MIFLWIVLAILGALLLLVLSLTLYGKATVRIVFRKKLRVVLQIGRIPITLISDKEKKPKELKRCRNPRRVLKKELRLWKKHRIKEAKKQRKKQNKKLKKAQKKALNKGKPKPNVIDYAEMAWVLLQDLLDNTSGRIDFRIRRLHLAIATKEASSTALLYATAQQGIIYLLHWVETNFNYVQKDRDAIQIFADFGSEKTSADIDVSASRHLSSAISVAWGMLGAYRDELKFAQSKAEERAAKKSAASSHKAA